MKPFNLEEALDGKPVVTRDGRKVTIVKEYHGTNKHPIGAIIHNPLESEDNFSKYLSDGRLSVNFETKYDLFMAAEKKELWVNVYPGTYPVTYLCAYSSKERADKYAGPTRLTCVKIEYEE